MLQGRPRSLALGNLLGGGEAKPPIASSSKWTEAVVLFHMGKRLFFKTGREGRENDMDIKIKGLQGLTSGLTSVIKEGKKRNLKKQPSCEAHRA